MTNAAPVHPFDPQTPHEPGGGNCACAGAGDEPAPAAAFACKTSPSDADDTVDMDVESFGIEPRPPVPRRAGAWTALALSLAIHGGVVALGAWAVAAGVIPLDPPTLGSRGEMAEGGLTDDLGISALTRSGPVVPARAEAPVAESAPPNLSDEDAPIASAAELFPKYPIEPPAPTPVPLIGIGEQPVVPPTRRQSSSAATAAMVSNPSASDSNLTPVVVGGNPSAGASAASSDEGDGAAPFTPPQVTGRGAGLKGRRGARGLDSRGLPIPDYPRESRRRGETGTVVLDVSVRADGRVSAVQVVTSSGHPRLDEAAVAALRDVEFTPALLGGRPVEGTVRVPYRFRLD